MPLQIISHGKKIGKRKDDQLNIDLDDILVNINQNDTNIVPIENSQLSNAEPLSLKVGYKKYFESYLFKYFLWKNLIFNLYRWILSSLMENG